MADANAFQAAMKYMAEIRAERRLKFEARIHRDTMTAAEFSEEVRKETMLLKQCLAGARDPFSSIEAWCNEPDRLGWPRRYEWDLGTGYELFQKQLEHVRRLIENWRKCDYAAPWRVEHPTWRVDMTDEEWVAWELRHVPEWMKSRVVR
jgi:hypothetical protein